MNLTSKKYAYDFRADARAALKGHWGIAILVSLLASVLGVSESSGGINFNFNVDSTSLEEIVAYFSGLSDSLTLDELMPSVSTLLWMLVPILAAALAMSFVYYLINGCMRLGLCRFRLALLDGERATVGTLFSGFKNTFFKALGLRFLCDLFLTLWSLLVIVPVVILFTALFLPSPLQLLSDPLGNLVTYLGAPLLLLVAVILLVALSYRYAMVFYALAENEAMTPMDAIRESVRMMKGNKWRLFCLQLSFFGWTLLCVLTLGIGFLWLNPYVGQSVTAFYHEISGRAAVREAVGELEPLMKEF